MIKATHGSEVTNGGEHVVYIADAQYLPKALINKAIAPNEVWNEMYAWGKTAYISGKLV